MIFYDVSNPEDCAKAIIEAMVNSVCNSQGETKEAAIIFGCIMATFAHNYMTKEGEKKFNELARARLD